MGKAKRWIAALVAVSLAAAGGYKGLMYLKEKNTPEVIVVDVGQLIQEDYYSFDYGDSSLSGSITTNVIQNIRIDKDVIVKDLLVNQGDPVKQGDLLMTIDTTLDEMELGLRDLEHQKLLIDLEKARDRLYSLQHGGPITVSDGSQDGSSGESAPDGSTSDESSVVIIGAAMSAGTHYLAAAFPGILAADLISDGGELTSQGGDLSTEGEYAGYEDLTQDVPGSTDDYFIDEGADIGITDTIESGDQILEGGGQEYSGDITYTEDLFEPADDIGDGTEDLLTDEDITGDISTLVEETDDAEGELVPEGPETTPVPTVTPVPTDVPFKVPDPSGDKETFYDVLDYDAIPYEGEGTEEKPYVFLCSSDDDYIYIKGRFLNVMRGFDPEGKASVHEGGYWYQLEFYEDDIYGEASKDIEGTAGTGELVTDDYSGVSDYAGSPDYADAAGYADGMDYAEGIEAADDKAGEDDSYYADGDDYTYDDDYTYGSDYDEDYGYTGESGYLIYTFPRYALINGGGDDVFDKYWEKVKENGRWNPDDEERFYIYNAVGDDYYIPSDDGEYYEYEETWEEEYEDTEEENGMTREEAIKAAEDNIRSLEYQVKASEVNLAKLRKKCEIKEIYSRLDGTIIYAGNPDAGTSSMDSFLRVKSQEGFFVSGQVSEMMLDQLVQGTVIKCTTDMGETFDAEVIEVAEYPESQDSGSSSYYYDGNPNASVYGFTASIADQDLDISEETYLMSVVLPETEAEEDHSLTINKAFVRSDNGRSYVMKDRDGVLVKQYVRVGKTDSYGYTITITGGLRRSDKLAFPYSEDAVEGTRTTEGSLDQLYENDYSSLMMMPG
ncbi:MAG: biotin/lipoyl-binding protein [Blautia sp.]|nr:biotin/lipoyl-binding protein [Blautia sp.]